MRYCIILCFFITTTISGFSQKSSYNASFGIGTSSFIMPLIVGDGTSYKSSNSYQIGLSYNQKLSNHLFLQTGATWLHTAVSRTVTPYLSTNSTSYSNAFNLVSIPLRLKYYCTKNFVLIGGPMIDIDVTSERVISNQSGIGLGAAIGYLVPIGNTLNISVSPYVDLHNNFTFNKTSTSSVILDAGIKLVIGLK